MGARGKDDAARHCESMRDRSMEVVSSSAVPREWKCTPLDGRFACGFVGEMVCVIREPIATNQERCRGDARPGEGVPR
jgi:hypothetical protein